MKLGMVVRWLVLVLTLFAPQRIKRWALSTFLGYSIHSTASIGLSLVDAQTVMLRENSKIGHFSVVRNLHHFELRKDAGVGAWNWFAASPLIYGTLIESGAGGCVLHESSQITSRHYIDCAGGFELGDFSLMAGVRSTVFSHQINVTESIQSVGKVTIGSYCMLGSNVKVLPGSTIADRSVVAMGALVRGALEPSGFLWAGVPAAKKEAVDGEWFARRTERARWPNESR